MITNNWCFRVFSLILMVLLLTGCGGAPAPTATLEQASATSPAVPTVIPTSTDTPLPTATNTPAPTDTPAVPFTVGNYKPVTLVRIKQLNFLKDGTYREIAGALIISGTYVVNSNQIVLTEIKNTGLCYGFPGTYSWSFDGKELSLKVVEDKCPNFDTFKLALDGQWVKQP
jgi:hypothetical protein